jgi:hypothetical protein
VSWKRKGREKHNEGRRIDCNRQVATKLPCEWKKKKKGRWKVKEKD